MQIHKTDSSPEIVDMEGKCISVFFSPFKCDELRNWRCNNCGKLLFKYESEVAAMVVSSDFPKEKGPIHEKCGRCNLMYRCLW